MYSNVENIFSNFHLTIILRVNLNFNIIMENMACAYGIYYNTDTKYMHYKIAYIRTYEK